MDQAIINVPFGQLRLAADDAFLIEIEFLLNKHKPLPANSPILKEAQRQLAAYFKNPHYVFDLPMQLHGTDFQQRVWRALCAIPTGAPITYGELAKRVDSAPRAVGGACGSNPIPIIVPCHRVVSASGLGGFMHTRNQGSLDIKSWLLAHERGE